MRLTSSTIARLKVISIHGFCWAAYIAYELFFTYYSSGQLDPPKSYLIYYLINIGYFYGQIALLDKLNHINKIHSVAGISAILVLFIFYLITKSVIGAAVNGKIYDCFIFLKTNLLAFFFRGIYFFLLSTFYWAAGNIYKSRNKAVVAEKNRILAENEKMIVDKRLSELNYAYLRQQLNPHLIFNTLSFIYNAVHNCSEAGSRCVLLLADIMRFTLEDVGGDGKIILAKEVHQLRNLIEINRYRFNGNLNLEFQLEGNFDNVNIIPLILLTMGENLFKHGEFRDPLFTALIKLTIDENGNLELVTKNAKKTAEKAVRNFSMGLRNVKLRLEHAYPGQHQLEIQESLQDFEVKLTIHL